MSNISLVTPHRRHSLHFRPLIQRGYTRFRWRSGHCSPTWLWRFCYTHSSISPFSFRYHRLATRMDEPKWSILSQSPPVWLWYTSSSSAPAFRSQKLYISWLVQDIYTQIPSIPYRPVPIIQFSILVLFPRPHTCYHNILHQNHYQSHTLSSITRFIALQQLQQLHHNTNHTTPVIRFIIIINA